MLETEYLVIGGGMMGAAAARYLAQAGHEVIVAAPSEPETPRTARLDEPFASHLDEGRITRHFDPDPVWAELARASIEMYRNLEAESGISIFQERPVLYVGTPTYHDVIRISHDIAVGMSSSQETGLSLRTVDEVQTDYPNLNFDAGALILEQKKGAGYINPRHMVRAQLRLVRRAGGLVIKSAAIELSDTPSGKLVKLANGKSISAAKVLVATGAYSNACSLLPGQLDMEAQSRTVLLAEIDLQTLPALKKMPAILYDLDDKEGPLDTYLLPPIEYPDGKTYIKIGTGNIHRKLETPEDLQEWFTGGPSEETVHRLTPLFQDIVPAIHGQEIQTLNCAYCGTASGRPYIDQVDEHLYVCIGGNGKAAKSSSEIGRLAYLMLTDQSFPPATPRSAFTIQWRA